MSYISLLYLIYHLFILTLVCLIPGFLMYRKLYLDNEKTPDIIDLPLVAVFGAIFWILTLGIFGIVTVQTTYLFAIISATTCFLLYLFWRESHLRDFKLPSLKSMDALVVFGLFLFLSVVLGSLVAIMRWIPPGDAITHATIVSIFVDQKVYPYFEDVGLRSIGAPESVVGTPNPGFALLSSLLSFLTGIPSAYSVLVTAFFASVLIPLLLFTLVYKLLGNRWLALSFSLFSLLPPAGWFSTLPAFHILTSNLLNGTFPNQAGITLFLAFLIIYCTRSNDVRGQITLSILILGQIVVFGSFAVLSVTITSIIPIFLTIHDFFSRSLNMKALKSNLSFTLYAGIGVLVYIVFNREIGRILDLVRNAAIKSVLFRVYGESARFIPYFGFPWLGIVAGAALLSFLVIAKRPLHFPENRSFRLFALSYLVFAVILLLSLNPLIYDSLTWIFLPHRMVSILPYLSLVVILLFWQVLNRSSYKLQIVMRGLKARFSVRSRVLHYILLVGVLSLLSSTAVQVYILRPNFPIWQVPSEADIEAMGWIVQNVRKGSLILNDPTFAGLGLPSYGAVRVVNFFSIGMHDPLIARRACDFNMLFNDPANYDLFARLVTKWNVTHVYLTSQKVTMKYEFWSEGYQWYISSYSSKPYPPPYFTWIFDNNPYLFPLFVRDDTRVYKVAYREVNKFELFASELEFTVSRGNLSSIQVVTVENETLVLASGVTDEEGFFGVKTSLLKPINLESAKLLLVSLGLRRDIGNENFGIVLRDDKGDTRFWKITPPSSSREDISVRFFVLEFNKPLAEDAGFDPASIREIETYYRLVQPITPMDIYIYKFVFIYG